jgi:peptidyl-dipeptidase Dcp
VRILTSENPLLAPWSGPHGGLPPFDRVRVEHFEPAIERAMAEELEEVERIARDPAEPDFDNTLGALERSGRPLERVLAAYRVWSSALSSPEFQAVERKVAPRLAAYADRITQNEALFRRIEAVYEARERAGLTPEQQRLAWHHHTHFVRSGARLGGEAKARLTEINQALADCFTRFNQNVLADENEHFLHLTDAAELEGLSATAREGAAEAARARDLEGWVLENTRSVMETVLAFAVHRELRERAWRMFVSRGDHEGEHDNNPVISEILSLRAERARLLGYDTHAHWHLVDSMAGTPERAMELMEAVWRPAVERVAEEVADMREIARAEGMEGEIEPWDYRYYAEKVRKARFDLDQEAVRPYLQLGRLRDAMFWVAGELFGLGFEEIPDVPVYHPDVRVWEVKRSGGEHLGLFYFDPFARKGKRSGAWMDAWRRQGRLDDEVTTIVTNTCNFPKGSPGEPALISWVDATTLFHEFGHALHGLASDVVYPSLSGTEVPQDYVEFPSQVLEHWLSTPEVLERFARHVETDEPIPSELVERITRASKFNQGFGTTEFLSAALVDMRMHLAAEGTDDPRRFERETLQELGMPRELVMRHRTPHFQHVFGSDMYSAGYYSYLWADVLTADAAEAFKEGGGLYDHEIATRLWDHVLSRGNTLDPSEGYRAFRGRDPEVGALMRKRGFAASEVAAD